MAELQVKPQNQTPGMRFQELDALRGIAALMVVLFHFTMFRPQAALGFKLGVTGVDLFFIISGFVIFMSLNRVKTGADFVINRLSRLYPTYWTCVTITFLLRIGVDLFIKHEGLWPEMYATYLANMTMFQFYLGFENLDGPYWTMIIEMVFYMFVLALFQLRLLKNLTLISCFFIVLALIGTRLFFDLDWIRYTMNRVQLLQFTPLFLAGTLFYRIYTREGSAKMHYLILFFCLLSQIALFKFAGSARNHISRNEYAVLLVVYFGLFVFFVNHKLGFIVSRYTLFLGKISFALYLIHQFVGIGIIIPFITTRLHLNFWIGVAVALPIVILMATFVTYYVEVPMSKKMKEKLRLWIKPRISSESAAN